MEANFDGLVGPTHNYSGLSFGNEASQKSALHVANPRAAALQGLEKMKLLHSLGLWQGFFPPQPRPDFRFLHALGFKGERRAVLDAVARAQPELLSIAYSSSFMWAANAATVCPSADSADGKVHFTPANLLSTAHRALEAKYTSRMLQTVFADARRFTHHAALPPSPLTFDEGAANHTRLTGSGEAKGLHLFIYGREHHKTLVTPRKYPARQTLQASRAVARLHGLAEDGAMFVQQHPDAIDAGVFHNDVIAVGNEDVLLYHAQAFADTQSVEHELRARVPGLHLLRAEVSELAMEEAVSTYLFNSQLIRLPDGGMALVAPQECEEHPRAAALIRRWVEDEANPLSQAYFVDVKQSMKNGGGPACLRLRVALTEGEWRAVHPGAVYSPAMRAKLETWIKAHYRDRLHPSDLADPQLADEALAAQEALLGILGMEGAYD